MRLYLVYGVCALFAVLIAFRTPHNNEQKSQAMDQSAENLRVGWFALLGIGIMFFGHGSVGLFIVRIGRGWNKC